MNNDKININYANMIKEIFKIKTIDNENHFKEKDIKTEINLNKTELINEESLYYLTINKILEQLSIYNLNNSIIKNENDFLTLLKNKEFIDNTFDIIFIENKEYYDLLSKKIITIDNNIERIYNLKNIKIIRFFNIFNEIKSNIFLINSKGIIVEHYGKVNPEYIFDNAIKTYILASLKDNTYKDKILEIQCIKYE